MSSEMQRSAFGVDSDNNATKLLCKLNNKEYIVFSGGGVKGKAYNGALMTYDMILKICGNTQGLQSFKGFAGSSAGSLWAMLLAMNLTTDEIFDITMSQDTAFIYQHLNVLQFPKQFGLISNVVLVKPFEDILSSKGFAPGITLKQLYALTKKELEICVTCVNLGVHEMWNHRTTPDMRVVDAIVTSMTIPGLFSPTQVIVRPNEIRSHGHVGTPTSFIPPPWKGIQIIEKETATNTSVMKIGPRYYCDGGLTYNIPFHVFDTSKSIIFKFQETPDYKIASSKDYLFKLLYVPMAQNDKTCLNTILEKDRCNIISIHTGQINIMDIALDVIQSCALVNYAMYQMLDFWKTSCQEFINMDENKAERDRKWLEMFCALTVRLQVLISKLNNTTLIPKTTSPRRSVPTATATDQTIVGQVIVDALIEPIPTNNESSSVSAPTVNVDAKVTTLQEQEQLPTQQE